MRLIEKDCSIAEINPLLNGEGKVMGIRCKIKTLILMPLYRHKDILELRDLDEEGFKEIEGFKIRLKLHSALDGNIVVWLNGARFSDGYNGYH